MFFRAPPGWSYADIAKRNVPEASKSAVRSTPGTPNLEQQSGSGNVWGINKNRGGQEAAILPSEQLEVDRQKALRTDKRREHHPSRFRSASIRYVCLFGFVVGLLFACPISKGADGIACDF